MKTTIISSLLLLLAAMPALANGTPPAPTPSPTYVHSSQPVTTAVDSSSLSSSDADASARARAASVSGSSSQGGSATAAGGVGTASSNSSTGPATSGATISDQSSTRALGLSLPGPSVPSALPSARDCVGTTNWSAAAPLFLGSGGSSNQGVIAECMVAQRIEALRRACQFDSANKLEAQLVSRLIAFKIEPAVDVNLTDEQCRARLAPMPVIALAPAQPPIVFEAPAVAPLCPVPAPRGGITRRKPSVGCPK